MKTFKDLKAFVKRVQREPAWDAYFMLGGRMYQIYEYGDSARGSHVYFVNKRTHDMIEVNYTLPTVQYVNGERVERGEYRCHAVYFIPNNVLWRDIV